MDPGATQERTSQNQQMNRASTVPGAGLDHRAPLWIFKPLAQWSPSFQSHLLGLVSWVLFQQTLQPRPPCRSSGLAKSCTVQLWHGPKLLEENSPAQPSHGDLLSHTAQSLVFLSQPQLLAALRAAPGTEHNSSELLELFLGKDHWDCEQAG